MLAASAGDADEDDSMMWLGCGLLPDDLFIDVTCLHLYSWSLFVDINKGLNEGLALLG